MEDIVRIAIEHVGGKWKADREGGFWTIQKNGFAIEAEPFLRSRKPSGVWLGFDCSIGHKEFAKLTNFIMDERPHNFVSLRWFQKSDEVESIEYAGQSFRNLMLGILDELQGLEMRVLVDEFCRSRPDGPSMLQVCHLAALAWTKDIETLKSYQLAFASGNRLNFVPMIDKGMVDRAVERAAG